VTEAGEVATVEAGDVVFAPAGERHWHGALPNSRFAHITVTRKGAQTIQVEE
jgi:quercetin dioxygenase-like cupin family protein